MPRSANDSGHSPRFRQRHARRHSAAQSRSASGFLADAASGQLTWRLPARLLPIPNRLSPTEVRRRLWHLLPGLIPFLAIVVHPEPGAISWQARTVLGAITAGLTLYVLRVYHTIAREGERNRIVNLVSYWAGFLLLLVLFPAQPQLAVVVLVVQSFGDGSATLFGLMFGRRRLPSNREKTWVGSAAFLIISAPAATLIYQLWSSPPVSFWIAALCGGGAALASMVIESVPSRLSDNLRVNVVASAVVVACHSILVGWPA